MAPSLNGWLLGDVKEHIGNGSIVPGWVALGLAEAWPSGSWHLCGLD
jgi:hypothetical protein